jgi:hypothetical protein
VVQLQADCEARSSQFILIVRLCPLLLVKLIAATVSCEGEFGVFLKLAMLFFFECFTNLKKKEY